MRLGGPIFAKHDSPETWAQAVIATGYRAAYCPLPCKTDHDDATIRAYVDAAARHDILIAEVGAWSNPISPDADIRDAALTTCKRALDLADRLGAPCAVNITGSRGAKWDGPCAEDLTDETFERIVACVREIVDDVQPQRSVYALETMPWMYPDSPDSYLALLKAIDRPTRVGVHLDPVNLVNCPRRYFDTSGLLRECFAKLGPLIRSCHAKDVRIKQQLTLHLEEVRPGQGALDYPLYLKLLAELPVDTPLMLEHLPNEEEYTAGATHIRTIADTLGLAL